MKKTFIEKFTFWARNVRSRELFNAIKKYCRGNVLDVGGRDFYLIVKKIGIDFDSWTTLDCSKQFIEDIADCKFKLEIGDGCNMSFEDGRFDTVLNVQVLEHVLEPQKMVSEIARVLKEGGYGIFLIPQTATLHELPYHYYNFTRFWIKEVMDKSGLEVIDLKPLGGIWSSMASHMVYFFFQCHRVKGNTTKEFKRNILFYALYPFMIVFALLIIPISLILSIGDLTEEPNNHLVIVRKK